MRGKEVGKTVIRLPTCHEVSSLYATGEVDDWPWYRRPPIWLHLAICDLCRRYIQQLRLLGSAFRALYRTPADPARVADLRQRILRRLAPGFRGSLNIFRVRTTE